MSKTVVILTSGKTVTIKDDGYEVNGVSMRSIDAAFLNETDKKEISIVVNLIGEA